MHYVDFGCVAQHEIETVMGNANGAAPSRHLYTVALADT